MSKVAYSRILERGDPSQKAILKATTILLITACAEKIIKERLASAAQWLITRFESRDTGHTITTLVFLLACFVYMSGRFQPLR